jgi:hypothetical protein
LYWQGKGVEQDRFRANVYYSKGCDGDAEWACYNVATSYRNGEGVLAKDPVQAAALLRKSCDLGAAQACNLAGIMYHDGETGAKDFLLAFGLFHKACDDGYDWGCHNLASMYRKGTGIGRDEARADSLDRKACDGGIADACEEIGATGETAAAKATPTPTVPPPPTATPTPVAAESRWQRNCRVVWKSSNELVYTAVMTTDNDGDEETSLYVERGDLLALVNELDTDDEPELERARQTAIRAIEGAPEYDNPVPSFLGGNSADMTITPVVDAALDALWKAVGRSAKAAGESCPYTRFDTVGGGVMLDTETGLEWQAGPDERMTRDEAVAWVAGLEDDGAKWRMPTKKELAGLYDGGLRPQNMASLLNTNGSWVWTASEPDGSAENWGYSFFREASMVMLGCKFCDSRVFAVRSKQ